MLERTSETVEPVTPLFVHEIALTSIEVPSTEGPSRLFPVIGVWADLGPLRACGVRVDQTEPGLFPVLVITDSVLDSTNPAMLTAILAEADHDTDHEGTPSAFAPHWSLRLPTSWVGVATVVTNTPLQLRIVLVDGPPPLTPAAHALSITHPAVVVMPALPAVHDTLAQVMAPEWTVPWGVTATEDCFANNPDINIMRDQLWSNVAGIALGQERAFRRAVSFAEWVALLDSGDAEEQEKFDLAMEAADWMAESSMLEQVAFDEDGTLLLPPTMSGLADLISEATNPEAVASLQSITLEEAVDAFGIFEALLALCVVVAVRAHSSAASIPPDEIEQGRYSTTYLLGMWLDEGSDIPWWATRATHNLLLHHDTAVLEDLLSCNPSHPDPLGDGHGPLSFRFLHVLSEALMGMQMSPEEFTGRARGLDVVPAAIEDILFVCQRLIGGSLTAIEQATRSGQPQCPGCFAVDGLVGETNDQRRLVRAAVATLPLIADLDAEVNGLVVGEEDWKVHRDGFLMHWMNHTAVVPDRS